MDLRRCLKKSVIIKYFIILCSFKILILPVIILLQIEKELVRNVSSKKSPVCFCGKMWAGCSLFSLHCRLSTRLYSLWVTHGEKWKEQLPACRQYCLLNPKQNNDLHAGCFCLLLWMYCLLNSISVFLFNKAYQTAVTLNNYTGHIDRNLVLAGACNAS